MFRFESDRPAPRWPAFVILLGLYLTAHGYHSRDGDQAYRLPLLLHLQDARLFADDPFVRAFDAFNPHLGYLKLLDLASRPIGLSAALFVFFLVMASATAVGIDLLARSVWPESSRLVGVAAFGLLLLAQGGNIGTNHLFEATLLDRLLAGSIGWASLGFWVTRPGLGRWLAPPLLGLAALIHPSMGLQLAILMGGAWFIDLGFQFSRCLRRREGESDSDFELRAPFASFFWLIACLAPSTLVVGRQGKALFDGLPAEDFFVLAAQIQSPQHMLPHLWRVPQWLAFGCYPALAALALSRAPRPWPSARKRFATLLGVNLLGLALSFLAIEGLGDLRATLFQPFRLATVFRGLCLVAMADRVLQLWRGGLPEKPRAVLIASGLIGDWTLIAATVVEFSAAIANCTFNEVRSAPESPEGLAGRIRIVKANLGGWLTPIVFLAAMAYLSRHDTESGHVRWSLALASLGVYLAIRRLRPMAWDNRRAAVGMVVAWAVPILAAILPALPIRGKAAEAIANHCRFGETPASDLERIAAWCRERTPESARFIGPPGPKGFRLWSRRSLAFNRAGSPYHAAGLADWAARFRDHVGFEGTNAAFASAYLADRHALERRFDVLTDHQLADLARRQGADHVLKAQTSPSNSGSGPLELLRVEGRYAIYRVRASYPEARLAKAAN